MRCFSCHKFSLQTICKECRDTIFIPSISTRKVAELDVISFFKYHNIERFIFSKYNNTGVRIYRYFAKEYLKPFIEAFEEGVDSNIYLIAIDENIDRGYSHTAILSHYSQTSKIKALHSTLKAKNRVEYAGKSLEFRLNNPRDFVYTGKRDIEAILIDDIVTTGTTLQEAKRVLNECGVEIIFALTLADARD